MSDVHVLPVATYAGAASLSESLQVLVDFVMDVSSELSLSLSLSLLLSELVAVAWGRAVLGGGVATACSSSTCPRHQALLNEARMALLLASPTLMNEDPDPVGNCDSLYGCKRTPFSRCCLHSVTD